MPESSWGPAWVGLITVVLLIQTAALVALALASHRLAARARTLEEGLFEGLEGLLSLPFRPIARGLAILRAFTAPGSPSTTGAFRGTRSRPPREIHP